MVPAMTTGRPDRDHAIETAVTVDPVQAVVHVFVGDHDDDHDNVDGNGASAGATRPVVNSSELWG